MIIQLKSSVVLIVILMVNYVHAIEYDDANTFDYRTDGLAVVKEYDEAGSFDYITDDLVVVSDSAYNLAATVDCYDIKRKKDISCFALQKPKWVAITFNPPRDRNSKVIKIQAISENSYKEHIEND